MPIKPIDFQIMIPRTMDASKSQNDDFSKFLSVQKSANNDLVHDSDKGLKQVQHRDKSFKASVDKDGKGNQGYKPGDQNHNDKKEKGSTNKESSMSESNTSIHIDIKI